MSAPYVGKTFRGTFGGCKAGKLLDELLDKKNEPGLIRKVSKAIVPFVTLFRDCCRYIHKKSLRDKVLMMFKKQASEKIEKMDLTEFTLTPEEEVFIRGYSNNIINVEYHRALESELGD